MRKSVILIFTILLALPNIVVATSVVSEITKPSPPEFTTEFVAHPYDVPPTYTTDPYTGETITHPGYHVENITRVIKVKNQPYTQNLGNGTEVSLYYQVRCKGHYASEWLETYHLPDYPVQSDSEYTYFSPKPKWSAGFGVPDRGELDIQVQALIGRIYLVEARFYGGANYWTFEGEKSDWSDTQTITVNLPTPTPTATSPTPTSPVIASQNPTLTPNQPVFGETLPFGLDWIDAVIVVLLAVVVVLLVFVVFYLRKRTMGGLRS